MFNSSTRDSKNINMRSSNFPMTKEKSSKVMVIGSDKKDVEEKKRGEVIQK
jgi:hypothetical protein